MRKRLGRVLAALCAAAVLFSLLLAGSASADEISIYHVAENDKMLTLPLDAMPAWINGSIYVPYTVFDWNANEVNLGVTYGLEHNESAYNLTLYGLSGTLVFDLNAGTCTDRFTGQQKDMKAVLRNGWIFVPLAGVCSYFGLKYSYTPTTYGTLIRITNDQNQLSTNEFVKLATDSLRSRYYNYLKAMNPAAPQTTPTPTPAAGSSGAETGQRDVTVYLAFRCGDGEGLEEILDTLEEYGAKGLFFFPPESLAEQGDLVRRLAGSGHGVGLLVDGTGAETALEQLKEGSALLERIAHLPAHAALPEEPAAGVIQALEQAGWACWSGGTESFSDGRSQSARSSELLRAAEGREDTVRFLLDDTADSAGVLARTMARMSRSEYHFRLAVETEL